MSSSARYPNRVDQRVLDIIRAIERIQKYVCEMTREQFLSNEMAQDAVARQILIIAEACDKIAEIEDKNEVPADERLRVRCPDIPWSKIKGIGNRIRHGYGTLDPEMFWETARSPEDLPPLESALKAAFPILARGD
ncbi:MAG: HepT-like ribonuclease domain-containing protein [Candidatus Baltobacteraceae bacterium]